MVSNISPLIAIFLWLMIPNVVSIQVLTSSSSNQSPLEIPDSDVSGLDGFTLCFRVFSHQFNKNFNPLITFPTSDEAPNPIRFGTVSAPCQFVSGKVLVYLKLIFILNCLHEKVVMR